MSRRKLTPQEEDRLTAIIVSYFNMLDVSLPADINRAALRRLMESKKLAASSTPKATQPTAELTEDGPPYVATLLMRLSNYMNSELMRFIK